MAFRTSADVAALHRSSMGGLEKWSKNNEPVRRLQRVIGDSNTAIRIGESRGPVQTQTNPNAMAVEPRQAQRQSTVQQPQPAPVHAASPEAAPTAVSSVVPQYSTIQSTTNSPGFSQYSTAGTGGSSQPMLGKSLSKFDPRLVQARQVLLQLLSL